MKKFITISILVFTIGILSAQTPPPPPNDPSNGNTNGPVGGGAPVGSGMVLLMAMAAGYGGKKVYDFRKRKLVE